MKNEQQKANRKLTWQLWLFAAGFLAFGFALVPLYNVLCDVTGYGDRTKLRQVLYNFLAYAINRSPDGGVVRATAESGSTGFLLKIENEGESPAVSIGLEELHATDRRFGDSELGLAIARQNVDLVGATMNWEARQPRGLRIVIQLPPVTPEADNP